jgi:hypothetical protein
MPKPQSRGCQDNERTQHDIDECHEFHLRVSPLVVCLCQRAKSRDTPCRRPVGKPSDQPHWPSCAGTGCFYPLSPGPTLILIKFRVRVSNALARLSATPPFGTLRRGVGLGHGGRRPKICTIADAVGRAERRLVEAIRNPAARAMRWRAPVAGRATEQHERSRGRAALAASAGPAK